MLLEYLIIYSDFFTNTCTIQKNIVTLQLISNLLNI